MYGIKFKIKNEYNKTLHQILENIDKKNYQWKIVEEEVYTEQGNNLFKKNCYSNHEFKNIAKNNIYYTIFVNIQLYKSKETEGHINTYQDFMQSHAN